MAQMSIGQLAERTGVPASTIRYYEQIELLPKPARVSGQRRYDESAIGQLELITFGRSAGMSLSEIARLLHGYSSETPARERWQYLSSVRLSKIDDQITRLQEMRERLAHTLECTCETLTECSDELASHRQVSG